MYRVQVNLDTESGVEARVERSHTEQLVYTSSEDGLLLEGVAFQAASPSSARPSLVWIHGNGGRFYDYPYVAIGRGLAAMGWSFVSGNTRGHDISAFVWRAADGKPAAWRTSADLPVGAGAGWEVLEEAPRDLAAWVDLAAELGSGRVVLAGHSAGAQRVLLYQLDRLDPRVIGLVLASPDVRGFAPPGELEVARRLVAEGKGMDVLPAQPWAPWYRQSARTVAARADALSRLSGADDGQQPGVARLAEPVLALAGAAEPGCEAILDGIRGQLSAARVETHVVAEADHAYSGREAEVARLIATWLERLAE